MTKMTPITTSDAIRWTFTTKDGRRVEVSGPRNKHDRDALKLALRRFSTFSVGQR